jgi:hypothetical protein
VVGENIGGSLSCGKVGGPGYLYLGCGGGISGDCYKPVKEQLQTASLLQFLSSGTIDRVNRALLRINFIDIGSGLWRKGVMSGLSST